MICMLKAHIPMTERCDVQVGSHLFHLYTPINPTCRPIFNLVVRRSVCCMSLACTAVGRRRRRRKAEKTLDTWEWGLLVGCPAAGGGDDFRGGGDGCWTAVSVGAFLVSCMMGKCGKKWSLMYLIQVALPTLKWVYFGTVSRLCERAIQYSLHLLQKNYSNVIDRQQHHVDRS